MIRGLLCYTLYVLPYKNTNTLLVFTNIIISLLLYFYLLFITKLGAPPPPPDHVYLVAVENIYFYISSCRNAYSAYFGPQSSVRWNSPLFSLSGSPWVGGGEGAYEHFFFANIWNLLWIFPDKYLVCSIRWVGTMCVFSRVMLHWIVFLCLWEETFDWIVFMSGERVCLWSEDFHVWWDRRLLIG
jgi:hypothetical protein